jgi:exopolysaccharide biosynthesis polyprenyl glycosylphosphotransferase
MRHSLEPLDCSGLPQLASPSSSYGPKCSNLSTPERSSLSPQLRLLLVKILKMNVDGSPAERILLSSLEMSSARPLHRPVKYPFAWVLALLTSDVVMFAIATVAATGLVLSIHPLKLRTMDPVVESSVMTIVFQLLMFERLGLYRRSFALSFRDEFYCVTTAISIGCLPLLIFFTAFPQLSSSRLIILVSLAFSVAGVGLARAAIRSRCNALQKRRPRKIAIVGCFERAEAAARSLNVVDGTDVLRIDVEDLDESITRLRPLFESDLSEVSWFAMARAWGCDSLLLTEALPPAVLPVLLRVAARHHIMVAFAPPRFRVHAYSAHLEVYGEQALLVLAQLKACTPLARVFKRLVDVLLATLVLLIAAPVLVLAAIAIWIESPGPVVYRQRRVGLNGEQFDIYKLRSMKVGAEGATGPVWAERRDARVTRVGRFLRRTSLDELPQFVNVLRNEMSIVGPRPERPEFVNAFSESIARYDERHLVRPGLTGWSQINLRRTLRPSDVAEKLSYDLFYIEQWSLFLDISIVAKTAFEFLFHDAA